jgi:hypothetical protein
VTNRLSYDTAYERKKWRKEGGKTILEIKNNEENENNKTGEEEKLFPRLLD